MKILLLKDVSGLGRKGEVKEVKEGYAQNHLLPKGLGEFLNKHGLKLAQDQQRKLARVQNEKIKNKCKIISKINCQVFTYQAKADDKGGLYSKFDQKALSLFLANQGYDINPSEIDLTEPIKKIGEYQVGVKISGQAADIKIILIR